MTIIRKEKIYRNLETALFLAIIVTYALRTFVFNNLRAQDSKILITWTPLLEQKSFPTEYSFVLQ